MSDKFYKVFMQEEWLVPATAEFTGISIASVQKIWDKAKKSGKPCVLTVPGDMPDNKRCKVCSSLARKDARTCKTCGTE